MKRQLSNRSSLIKIIHHYRYLSCFLFYLITALPVSAQDSYFTDVELINQHGQKMRLYSDVIKGKVVVINTFFTSCEGVCPLMSNTISYIQKKLGQKVQFVSISVDPLKDTPDALKDYANRFKALSGWIFLTGSKQNVDLALSKLGGKVDNRESHNTIFIVGNEPTGLWKKANGLANNEEILKVVSSVLNDG
jgi:protein SCO1/2